MLLQTQCVQGLLWVHLQCLWLNVTACIGESPEGGAIFHSQKQRMSLLSTRMGTHVLPSLHPLLKGDQILLG